MDDDGIYGDAFNAALIGEEAVQGLSEIPDSDALLAGDAIQYNDVDEDDTEIDEDDEPSVEDDED